MMQTKQRKVWVGRDGRKDAWNAFESCSLRGLRSRGGRGRIIGRHPIVTSSASSRRPGQPRSFKAANPKSQDFTA
jgi:hypothetical protein